MHRLIPALALLLTACTAAAPVAGFRDPARAIYSSAVLDPARLTGHWHQVADFAAAPGCAAAGVRFVPGGAAGRIDGQLCLAGVVTTLAGPITAIGPGRFAVAGLADPLWVLWADTDVRTLVIGTPAGRFGVILNRDTALPQDRLTAAREVLAWNGYDLDRLQISR